MMTLHIDSTEEPDRVVELSQSRVTIGRDASSQIVIASEHLSFEHGQIFWEAGHYYYRDLGSTNGSRVRREEQEWPVKAGEVGELVLQDGDVLLLGSTVKPVAIRVEMSATVPKNLDGVQEVIIAHPFSMLPQVKDRVVQNPERSIALYELARRLGRKGNDLPIVFDVVGKEIFSAVPRASHLSIDLIQDRSRIGGTVKPSETVSVYRASRDQDSKNAQPFSVSRAVLQRVLKDGAAMLVSNAEEELGTQSVLKAHIVSILGVPLWEGESIFGVIQCDNRQGSHFLMEEDLDVVTAISGLASLAIENARLVERLRIAEERLQGENRYLKGREERRRFGNIIGESVAMKQVFGQLDKVIDTKATVCIEGETGTGKEVIASAIHYQGLRRDKLFVTQNCAALPENLLESELFGHKRGAFTGADQEKKGLFEIADGGTLFLDEIGEMSLSLQAKLLRVLQEGQIRQLGATTVKSIDVRILCATNRALTEEVKKGTFRQDLYYRLHVYPIVVPPLRNRREDIPLLVDHFMQRYTAEMSKVVAGITPDVLLLLEQYDWPGNIRELQNEVQRLVIQAEPEQFITTEMLSPGVRRAEKLLGQATGQGGRKGSLREQIEEVERWLLLECLREHHGNKTRAAETLGMTREGLHKKLAKYGIS